MLSGSLKQVEAVRNRLEFDGRKDLRVLVCGGRDYQNHRFVIDVLDRLLNPEREPLADPDITIIHGGARGADASADSWAATNFCGLEEYKADWNTHDRSAGAIRNSQMLHEGKPDLVIAFPGGPGTADMIKKARAKGLVVIQIYD